MGQHDCHQTTLLEYMGKDISEIRKDVKKLLGFKMKFAGGLIVISVIITLITNLIIIYGG